MVSLGGEIMFGGNLRARLAGHYQFSFRQSLSLFLAAQLGVTQVWALEPHSSSTRTPQPVQLSTAEQQDILHRSYWAMTDNSHPELVEFAFHGLQESGDAFAQPLLHFSIEQRALLDSDPFWMRSQVFVQGPSNCSSESTVCSSPTDQGLALQIPGVPNTLILKQPLNVVGLTQDRIFLSTTQSRFFAERDLGNDSPLEGLFVLHRASLEANLKFSRPTPLFFVPMLESGWAGAKVGFVEGEQGSLIFHNHSTGDHATLTGADLQIIEQSQRNNLLLAQTWTMLAEKQNPTLPGHHPTELLPMVGATLLNGLVLSSEVPSAVRKQAGIEWQRVLNKLGDLALPQAHAEDAGQKPSLLTRIRSKFKAWALPISLYGTKLGISAWMLWDLQNSKMDWSNLFTADIGQRVATVGAILGVVALTSFILRMTIHRQHFREKYGQADNTSWFKEARQMNPFLDELAHGLWTSLSIVPQTVRNVLDVIKDRLFPRNKTLNWVWEQTIGFMIKTNEKLAMNHRTFKLGALVFGMADAFMVALDVIIWTPWIMQTFEIGTFGAATAAYASSMVLSNFLSYLQSGAHTYSHDVKTIELKSAQDEVRRAMIAENLNPHAARNQTEFERRVEKVLDQRFRSRGLPGADEFLYDPGTILEWVVKKSGYSREALEKLTPQQLQTLSKHSFVIEKRRLGLVVPSLKLALKTAKRLHERTGRSSPVAENVINVLSWAKRNRGFLFAHSSAARDIRFVMFLMTTNGDAHELEDMLPQSWIDNAGGSKEAAAIAAHLFHRAFFAYYSTKFEPKIQTVQLTPEELQKAEILYETQNRIEAMEMIVPSKSTRERYGSEAEKIVNQLGKTHPLLMTDAFAREVQLEKALYDVAHADREKLEVAAYVPADHEELASKKWKSVQSLIAASQLPPLSQQEGQMWTDLAREQGERLDVGIDPQTWTERHLYRFTVAQAFAKKVGLIVRDPIDSELVRETILEASKSTDAELIQPHQQSYMNRLTTQDAQFYAAQTFTKNFINSYVQLTVRDEDFDHTSPEFPGRMQKWRQKPFVQRNKFVRGLIRFAEGFWRNEEDAYRPTRMGAFSRNMFIVPDLTLNFGRSLQIAPYYLTFSYLTNYFIWQIHIPWSLAALGAAMTFIHYGVVEINNRIARNLGMQPMRSMSEKLTFSFFHSTATNPIVMVEQAASQAVTGAFATHVVNPLHQNILDPVGNQARIVLRECDYYLTRWPLAREGK